MRKRGFICGKGIVDVEYPLQKFDVVDGKRKRIWVCPIYVKWKAMLERAYSDKFKLTNPTYVGVTVCEEWLYFSNFKNWVLDQKLDFENLHLDKDLLVKGNKEYRPDRCVFVTKVVNSFSNDHGNARGDYPLGVSKEKSGKTYRARVWNPLTGKREYLGNYKCPVDAHNAWLERKHELAQDLANSKYVVDNRVAEALKNLYKQGEQI